MGTPVSVDSATDPPNTYPPHSEWNRMSDLELEAGWLTSGAASVFLMQLGFLAFEVGFVEAIWVNSIIIKNIEDTIVGTLTYVLLGHTLCNATTVWGGVIGSLENAFLIGISKAEHEAVFINAMYAVTCATIISGAVLERMKNSAYVAFTFTTILLNYSLAACWAWNPGAWLCKMGFIDCAGSFVVHGVGGITSIVACYFLGPRRGALMEATKDEGDENKTVKKRLKEPDPATNPTMLAFGGFILWYGWFAFNVTSPIVSGTPADKNLGQTGLNTLLAPCAAACSCILYRGLKIKRDKNAFKKIVTMEDLIGTILAGAVAITASCYTVPWWASIVIGFGSSFVYFFAGWLVREVLVIDDPLGVCNVHLFPGFYGVFCEGLFADGSVGDPGLFYGGYRHFGVQVLGVVAGSLSQLVLTVFIWKILLEKCMMPCFIKCKGKNDIRVDTLDTYLGVGFFDIDPESAFKDMIKCDNKYAKRFLLSFSVQCNNSGQGNELDFLVCVYNLRKRYRLNGGKVNDKIQDIIDKIYAMYIGDEAQSRVNITPQEKSLIEQSKKMKNITLFDSVYNMKFDELKAQLTAFLKNMNNPKEYKKLLEDQELPYDLRDDWSLVWITDDIRRDTVMDENNQIEMPLISQGTGRGKTAVVVDMDAVQRQITSNQVKEEEEEKKEEEGGGANPGGQTNGIATSAVNGGTSDLTPGYGSDNDGNTIGGSVDLHKSLSQHSGADAVVDMSAI